ncbi:MAG TPA: S8 family serine peptidase [Pirellulaceae bacterium]|nr:S8 family serine peptidase [Pirellulaceae bacterium]
MEYCEIRRVCAGDVVFGPLPPPQLESPAPVVGLSTAARDYWTGLDAVRANWSLDGRGQTVAVIDSGIAYEHTALGGGFGGGRKVVGGWDFAENDADPHDDGPAGFHGTHVAGIIGSTDDDYPGVAPGAALVALRVFDDHGATQLTWIEQALRWVHAHRFDYASPITAVNLSVGTPRGVQGVPDWSTLEDELAQLRRDGIVVVVAAGNGGADEQLTQLSYPAASPSVLAAASLDPDGRLSQFSRRSSETIAAPGRDVMSTVPDFVLGADGKSDDFAPASGTSMAAPYVAAASVLVREALARAGVSDPTVDLVVGILRQSAAFTVGGGSSASNSSAATRYARLDLEAAVRKADELARTIATAAGATATSPTATSTPGSSTTGTLTTPAIAGATTVPPNATTPPKSTTASSGSSSASPATAPKSTSASSSTSSPSAPATGITSAGSSSSTTSNWLNEDPDTGLCIPSLAPKPTSSASSSATSASGPAPAKQRVQAIDLVMKKLGRS